MRSIISDIKNVAAGVFLAVTCSFVVAADNVPQGGKGQNDGSTYVLVVSGISKDPQDRSAKTKVVSDLQRFLLQGAKIGADRLTILVSGNALGQNGAEVSTAENLQKTINAFGAKIKSEDRFIFYYVGQANVAGENLRFNLPGSDITQEQLAEWIKVIKASSMLIVLDCPSSGLAAKALSGPGRVVICSCTAEQPYSTRFSEYFVPALTDSKTDTDSDKKISVLEAFTAATRQVDDWYRQKKLLTTETPILEDDGDGQPSKQPWRYKLDGKDGLAASRFFFSQ